MVGSACDLKWALQARLRNKNLGDPEIFQLVNQFYWFTLLECFYCLTEPRISVPISGTGGFFGAFSI